MKLATTTTKMKAELKTICTADINASVTLPWWCQWRDKLSVLFELRHAQPHSNFLFKNQPRAYTKIQEFITRTWQV